jgi:hypothetical protein
VSRVGLNSGIARLTCAGGLHENDLTQLARHLLKRSNELPRRKSSGS